MVLLDLLTEVLGHRAHISQLAKELRLACFDKCLFVVIRSIKLSTYSRRCAPCGVFILLGIQCAVRHVVTSYD